MNASNTAGVFDKQLLGGSVEILGGWKFCSNFV